MFFLSGFCGLLYELIWLRLAMLNFGVIAPVVSVVIAVFMAGLGLGSWLGGHWIARTARHLRLSPMVLYAFCEAIIGLSSLAVPRVYELGAHLLLQQGDLNSTAYLASSAAVIFISIFPWTFFMGLTYPLVMAFVHEEFSYLYLANVLGGAIGSVLTAFVLIELLGFKATLGVAGSLNIVIALLAFWVASRQGFRTVPPMDDKPQASQSAPGEFSRSRSLLLILFVSGFSSMAMEVVWTRCFAGTSGSTVYAFALILAYYLVATFTGTALYRKIHRESKRPELIPRLLVWATACGLLPAIAGEIRLDLSLSILTLSVFPVCMLLGYLTPAVVDEYSNSRPELAGVAYGVNILGCILGPLFVSYCLFPYVSERAALVVLALPFTIIGFRFCWQNFGREFPPLLLSAALSLVILFGITLRPEGPGNASKVIKHDAVATVVSLGAGQYRQLLVNGVGMTKLTTITKLMVHMPLALHEGKPSSALIICFGMGTTFRSALSWEVKTTAVELVPSVFDAFDYYHADATAVRRDVNGTVFIDDGRRFLERTTEQFDVIVIDPPPPISAAASGMLYSTEFYQLVRSHLKAGGVFQQWYPAGDAVLFRAVLRSFSKVFPNVRLFGSIEGWGVHLLGSMNPIEIPNAEKLLSRVPARARKDLIEWQKTDELNLVTRFLSHPLDPVNFLVAGETQEVTDDRPLNEYFLLRDWLKR